MRKVILGLVTSLLVILAGCGANQASKTKSKATAADNSVVKNTQQATRAASKTWVFDQAVSSKQTKRGLQDTLTTSVVSKLQADSSWTTAKGQFTSNSIDYQRVSLAKWKRDGLKHVMKSYQHTVHYVSVAQVNAVLKKLGADVQIHQLTDLVFLETKNGGEPLSTGFVASGHHLYEINVEYRDADTPTTVDRGTKYTDTATKTAVSHVDPADLAGTWIAPETTTSATDTGKMMVKAGYLYQHRYDSFERSAVQDLATYSLTSLNQNTTYAEQKRNAAKAGYHLTNRVVASGDSLGYLYLFISKDKMIRIGQGDVTTYEHTSATVAPADLPTADVKLFDQTTKKHPGSAASTVTVKAGAPKVGMSSSVKYLTDPEAGQITSEIVID
ncbi:hypothetical protein D1831_10900 [Lactiplantibacillus garii]|uniref:Lipoprotein n=1 Tax=Lactiplantibacillus garii TaxID=2306423 RepID=A0A426D563_9LACO|nr:hypothetical protein [Lactiplantibacillus garii]RRK09756.1 hypothetical protein D1831_10900 [Lactiplantibacillus garii]